VHKLIVRLFHPDYFQGQRQKKSYFEGWYFKCISADRKRAIAIIPGMAIDPQGARHSFIQVINAVSGKTYYFHFPYAMFESPTDRFAVRIGENTFDSTGIALSVQSSEGRITGRLFFSNAHAFPTSWHNPGIMGPFAFFPFMECYHAIIHLYHTLHGTIELDGETMDFKGGTGYIEKDYGHSFPRTYLWLQASHFDNGEASFVFSQARIPFLWTVFPGFFAYFTDFSGVKCRFATYNRSRLVSWQVDLVNRTCSGELKGPSGTLLFSAQMAGGGRLRAPIDGLMDREIIESISAQVQVTVKDRRGNIRYQGMSSEAGMEICF
jgi:tocopherol cyclase